jgi:hypothetical protein
VYGEVRVLRGNAVADARLERDGHTDWCLELGLVAAQSACNFPPCATHTQAHYRRPEPNVSGPRYPLPFLLRSRSIISSLHAFDSFHGLRVTFCTHLSSHAFYM